MDIFRVSAVIPVLTINNIKDAISLSEALVEAGLTVIEVTLRTENAFKIIKEISSIKKAVVGAGTILSESDVKKACYYGAQFGVSPGMTEKLRCSSESEGLPLLGGVSSASEVMRMLENGYNIMKFFPAEASGGVAALKSIAAPLPDAYFCPTGGISGSNVEDYLCQPNVIGVGGSWMLDQALIKKKDWPSVSKAASKVARIGKI